MLGKNVFSYSDNEPLDDKSFNKCIWIKFGLEDAESIRKFKERFLNQVIKDFREKYGSVCKRGNFF